VTFPAHGGHCVVDPIMEKNARVWRVSVALNWVGIADNKGYIEGKKDKGVKHVWRYIINSNLRLFLHCIAKGAILIRQ